MKGLDLHDAVCSRLTTKLCDILTDALEVDARHTGPSYLSDDAAEIAAGASLALHDQLFEIVSAYRMAMLLAEYVDAGVVKLSPEQLADGLALIES